MPDTVTTTTTRTWEHWRDVRRADWRWPNFSPAELACRGTGRLVIDTDALDRLEALRKALGDKPLMIRSAYRSPEWNRKVKGKPNSQHLTGRAFDVGMGNHDPHLFVRLARACGFTGVGTYPKANFVHVDVGPLRQWGEEFPDDTPVFTPEPRPPALAETRTARATVVTAGAGVLAVASQASPAIDALGRAAPAIEAFGRLPWWAAVALVIAVAGGVLVWRARR
jgi:zinc D-Ala-D-Ala carboxypeptidase